MHQDDDQRESPRLKRLRQDLYRMRVLCVCSVIAAMSFAVVAILCVLLVIEIRAAYRNLESERVKDREATRQLAEAALMILEHEANKGRDHDHPD